MTFREQQSWNEEVVLGQDSQQKAGQGAHAPRLGWESGSNTIFYLQSRYHIAIVFWSEKHHRRKAWACCVQQQGTWLNVLKNPVLEEKEESFHPAQDLAHLFPLRQKKPNRIESSLITQLCNRHFRDPCNNAKEQHYCTPFVGETEPQSLNLHFTPVLGCSMVAMNHIWLLSA